VDLAQQCGLLPNRSGDSAIRTRLPSQADSVHRPDVLAVGPRPENVSSIAFKFMAESSAYRTFASAFHGATGLYLALVPACDVPGVQDARRWPRVEFCRLLRRFPAGATVCRSFDSRVLERAVAEKRLCSATCFAGIVEAAIPIFSTGTHLATLVAGGGIQNRRGRGQREGILTLLGNCGRHKLDLITRAYQSVPVIQRHRIQAACRLLEFFAQTLEEHIPGWLLCNSHDIPPAVAKAEEYIDQNLGQTIRLPTVARYAGVCVQHLCKLFRASTGLTFKQFLAWSRTEKAKALLHDASARVSDVAFECGFNSVSTFNRIFKRLVGKAPKAYQDEILRGKF
jgi:AraC-like DNA-binding protein/ligand-binding sensor protein